jgi:hypothetical protein
MIRKLLLPVLAVALLAAGCANQKEPATKAVADAEAALAAVRDQAAQYAPDQLQGVEGALSGLKDSLGKGDYKAVLASAPKLVTDVAALKDTAAAAMQAAMDKANGDWAALAADLPNMVGAIESRVNILSKARKLPAGIDKAGLDAAKTGLDGMKASWTEAGNAFASGNVMEAVKMAQDIKTKGAEIMAALGMTTG